MNKRTKALTTEQYKEIIQTMREGFCGCRPNERIATALVLYLINNIPSKCDGTVRSVLKICEESLNIL